MTTRRPRILVGCDSSTESREALAWAIDYVRRVDGSLTLACAWEWPTFQGVPVVYGSYDPRKCGTELLERLRGELALPEDRVTLTVAKGNPSRVLLDLGEDADLLVVGSHGLDALSRFMLGSVSARVAAHASCPVVIVRHADTASARPTVLVGADDSPSSRAALRWAMDYAELTSTPLTVLHAAEPPPPPIPAGYPVTFSYPRAAVHRSLRSWLRDLIGKEQADRGRELPDVTLRVMDGNPGHVLVEESQRAVLTVVGRRGAGGFRRLLIGSVASALAHHGQSTIVVVPPA